MDKSLIELLSDTEELQFPDALHHKDAESEAAV